MATGGGDGDIFGVCDRALGKVKFGHGFARILPRMFLDGLLWRFEYVRIVVGVLRVFWSAGILIGGPGVISPGEVVLPGANGREQPVRFNGAGTDLAPEIWVIY